MSDYLVKGTCPECRDESLILSSSDGEVRCKKRKGNGQDACPDPGEITRLMHLARWMDEAFNGDEDVWRATINLPDDWTVAEVKAFGKMLEEFDRVVHSTNLAENIITLQIHPPYRLSHSFIPAGTHEFARGWGVRHVMGELAAAIGHPIEWREYRVSPHQPWRQLRESKETVTV